MRNMQATRERCGVTLRQLHELTGIDVGTLSRYENGKREPSVGRAAVVAHALGVSLEYLVGADHDGNDARPLDPRGKSHEPDTAAVEAASGSLTQEVSR